MYIYTFDLFLSKLIRYDWPMRSKCVRIRFYPSKWIDGCWRAACTSGISTCRNSYSGSLHSQKKFIHLWIIRCGRLGPKGTRYGNQYRWIINLWNDISCKAAFFPSILSATTTVLCIHFSHKMYLQFRINEVMIDLIRSALRNLFLSRFQCTSKSSALSFWFETQYIHSNLFAV